MIIMDGWCTLVGGTVVCICDLPIPHDVCSYSHFFARGTLLLFLVRVLVSLGWFGFLVT